MGEERELLQGKVKLSHVRGNHPKNNLAKFGYIIDVKVGEKQKTESFYVLGYLLELIIKTWEFGGVFFFFPLKLGENSPIKEML
jgi:hypothetical protein